MPPKINREMFRLWEKLRHFDEGLLIRIDSLLQEVIEFVGRGYLGPAKEQQGHLSLVEIYHEISERISEGIEFLVREGPYQFPKGRRFASQYEPHSYGLSDDRKFVEVYYYVDMRLHLVKIPTRWLWSPQKLKAILNDAETRAAKKLMRAAKSRAKRAARELEIYERVKRRLEQQGQVEGGR